MKVGQRIKRQVYLTEAEEKYVLLKAKEYGYNFSRMCRYALLHLDDTSAKKKIQVTTEHNILIEERQRQLAAIGNNINQIARRANVTNKVYKEDIEEVESLAGKIIDPLLFLQKKVLQLKH